MPKRKIYIWSFLLIVMSSKTFGVDSISCDRTDIEDLRAQLECDELNVPVACSAPGLATIGSLSAVKFGSMQKIGSHKVDVDLLNLNKSAVISAQKAAANAQREAREFVRAMAEVISDQKASGEEVKIRGFNRFRDRAPTWSQLYSAYKEKMNEKIPGNELIKKMKTGVTPENFISSQVRAATSEEIKNLPEHQKSSFGKFVEIEQLRFNEYFIKVQQQLGVNIDVLGVAIPSNRRETAIEVSNARKSLVRFKNLVPKSCGYFAKNAAVAAGIGSAAQIATGATAWANVENCAKEFHVALSEDDKMFLIEASTLKAGAIQGVNCDYFQLTSESVDQYLSSKGGKYSSGMMKYLCELNRRRASARFQQLDKLKNLTIDCDRISADGFVASKKGSELQISLRSGSVVSIPSDINGNWSYSQIKSSDPNFHDYLIQKVRHPMVSLAAKMDVLKPSFSCDISPSTNESRNLCEVAVALQAWNHFSGLAHHECDLSESRPK